MASVLVALALGRLGVLPDGDVTFYITEIAVPLLTFTGFLAVYLGFRSQEEQNELQERQLENQRKEIEAQQKNFQKDRFESTFFQLLRTHNQIVEDIRIEQKRKTTEQTEPPPSDIPTIVDPSETTEPVETVPIRGRSCFEHFYSEFEELFEEKADEKSWSDLESAKEGRVRWVYTNWFADRKSDLNHYFSHLSKLISFVHRSDVEDKDFYIGLVTAQMSMPEQKLFFYHVNLKKDESNYRHLRDAHEVLGEYTFFEQVDKRALAHDLHYRLNKAALGMK